MEVAEARAVLGVGDRPTWTEVRIAYRAQIQAAHPDRVGGDTDLAARLNDAFATLRRARVDGRLAEPPVPAPPPPPSPPRPAAWSPPVPVVDEPPEVLDGDTVHLAGIPADEAFVHLLDACHRIGDVTYIDRSCAILETLVRVEGEGVCSLVITLQGRATGTDAFCTLEAIEHVATPSVRPVVDALVEALTSPR
jgi:hypothetical protein